MRLIKQSKSLLCGIKMKMGYVVMALTALLVSVVPTMCTDLAQYSDNGVNVIAYCASYGASYGWMVIVAFLVISLFISDDQGKARCRKVAVAAGIGWAICLVISDNPNALKTTIENLINAITGKSSTSSNSTI